MSSDKKEARIWLTPPVWSIDKSDPRMHRLIVKLEKAGEVQFRPEQCSRLVRIINEFLVMSSNSGHISKKQIIQRLKTIRKHAEALTNALEPRDSLGREALGILGYYLQLKNLDRENLLFECTVLAEAVRIALEPETILQEIKDDADDFSEPLLAVVEKLQEQLQRTDVPKGGRPSNWNQNHFLQSLFSLYLEAGGTAGRPYWNDYKEDYVGAFLDLVYLLLNELHCPAKSRTALAKQILRILPP